MVRGWTFGRGIAAGFAVVVALTVIVGIVSVISLQNAVSSKDRVIEHNSRALIDSQKMEALTSDKSSSARGFLLTADSKFVDEIGTHRQEFLATLQSLRDNLSRDEEKRLLQEIERDEMAHQQGVDAAIALRRTNASVTSVATSFNDNVVPLRNKLTASTGALIENQEQALTQAKIEANDAASTAAQVVTAMVILSIFAAGTLAFFLTRRLRRQIGTTVGEVQSSSAELQATANQQATGAKEQATAMNEISTTITELLATSRQIAESAQRVAQVAEQTAGAGRLGEDTVATAQASMVDIRRQVDLIVSHMLELGEKSQRIGAVLEIVSELAEQTNILAINSTIEAAGAGESGKRFAIVADEIRKLADRVADSTKEIRGLIEVVRSAVNTTVMATEIGSKAVDQGAQQFVDVRTSFEQIADLVTTTTEAAREIELSTKQQSTAVEQVNVAITSAAQATRETEASSGQTYQTATQLTELSKELQRLVESHANT